MTQRPAQLRPVTRGYVVALLLAALTVALSVIAAMWGLLGLLTGTATATDTDSAWRLLLLLAILAALYFVFGWRQSLQVLRGHLSLPWELYAVAAVLTTALVLLDRLLDSEAFTAQVWLYLGALLGGFLGSLCAAWLVLVRRVYTDRSSPQWPWEKTEAREREIEQLEQLWEQS